MKKRVVAIILAGGTGKRMASRLPKQFLELGGKPVIAHSIERFDGNRLITDIVVVCHKKYVSKMKGLIKGRRVKKIYRVVPGGGTRQESSFEGVKNCPPGTGFVLIHDAARPLVDDKIIRESLSAAVREGASGAAVDMDDTVVLEEKGFINGPVDRKTLKKMQTPQAFNYGLIYGAHRKALKDKFSDATDDCALVINMGRPVKMVKGSATNIKVTTPADYRMARALANRKK